MRGVVSAAHQFLNDRLAVQQAVSVDRRRDETLGELRRAFLTFREDEEPLERLAARLAGPLAQQHDPAAGAPHNLWGFENEDERRFATRLADVSARRPDLDLAAVVRAYLDERPGDDEERIQQLLAFGELVASLDAGAAPGEQRLGVGPAASFLTFAWHCLSDGREPVFSYQATRAIRALAKRGELDDPDTGKGDLEERFRSFFTVCRRLEGPLAAAPGSMRRGWAIAHALAWMQARLQAVPAGEEPAGGLWAPRQAVELASSSDVRAGIRIEPPTSPGTAAPSIGRPESHEEPALPAAAPEPEPAPEPAVAPSEAARSRGEGKGNRFLDIARRRVVQSDNTLHLDRPGVDLSDALPADRADGDQPFFLVKNPRERELRHEEERREETRRKSETRRLQRQLRERAEREAATPEAATPEAATPEADLPEADPPEADPTEAAPARTEAASAQGSAGPSSLGPPTEPSAPRGNARRDEESAEPEVGLDALLSEFRREVVHTSQGGEAEPPATGRIAQDLYLDPDLWEQMTGALEQRGAALLVGPAASGKTYVARRLAIHLAGHDDRVLFVRLHPALSYADLIDGPQGPGLVRAFCERAAEDRDRQWVLVLDELDRGDAAAALGEVLGALSERSQPVRLGRSHALFALPRNVQVVATARDLPHDPALVGRFPVVDHPADSGVLRRFLAHRHPGLEWVADLHAAVNARLSEQGHALRVGHGLLMDPRLDVSRLRGSWRREVLPLLAAGGVDPADYGYEALRPR